MPTTLQTQTKKDSNKMYLGLYTRVSTHLIMACSKGKEAETTNQTRACTETIRDILAKNLLVYLFSLVSYAAYPICGGGEKEQGAEVCVCVAHKTRESERVTHTPNCVRERREREHTQTCV